jgi:hypothetical protein
MRYLGETLDHLACSMMAFQDWPPRDQLTTFYEASRQQTGDDPISWRMAKALLETTLSNRTVILVTGEYGPNDFKYGETDGPVGIAVLSWVLARLGCRLAFVCDPHLFDVHQAIVDEFAALPLEYVAFPGGTGFDYRALAAEILERYDPGTLISCEKLGRSSGDEYHSAFGQNSSTHENRVDYLFDLAYEQGRLTLAFGDQGNEIGFGNIRQAAMGVAPWGRTCQCPCGQGIIAVTRSTYLLPATVSNWGAIAVANMLAALTNRPDLVHTEDRQRWLQEVLLQKQVIDGAFASVSRSVDSIHGDVDLAVAKLMEAATSRSLMTKDEYFGPRAKPKQR